MCHACTMSDSSTNSVNNSVMYVTMTYKPDDRWITDSITF